MRRVLTSKGAVLAVTLTALAAVIGLAGVRTAAAQTLTVCEGGDLIAFASNREGGLFNIFTVQPDGSDLRQLTDNGSFSAYFEDWSPDGSTILYTTYETDTDSADLWLMDADGGNQRPLFSDPAADDLYGRYSPDGTQIAYVRDTGDAQSLWIVDADGSRRALADVEGRFEFYPSWSPEGRYLAFAAETDSTSDIYVYDVEQATVSALTDDPNTRYFAPAWSPVSAELAFISNLNGDSAVYIMSPTGDKVERIPHESMFPYFVDWLPDGSALIVDADYRAQSDLLLLGYPSGGLTPVTNDLNSDWLPGWRPCGE